MTWTAPDVTRTREPFTGDERSMLQGWLDWHRHTLLHKCAGLTGDQLARRSVEPSTLTLLGLVRHMTIVERSWFRERAAGVTGLGELYWSDDNPDGDFDDADPAGAEADLARFLAEIALADEAVAALPLAHQFPLPPRGPRDLRWVYLHMIEEYARHNGHADLLRERIDGVTGD